MARRGDGIYLGGRTWWLDVTVAVVLLAVLTACSRREETTRSEEDIGSRLHRECVSIVNAAMGVEGGIDLTGGNLITPSLTRDPNGIFNFTGGLLQINGGALNLNQTNFTISYIANVAALTPAGDYTMVHDLVVVATY